MTSCPHINRSDWHTTPRWRVVLERDVRFTLPRKLGHLDLWADGYHLASMVGYVLTIHKGYACDGYSPVVRTCGRHIPLTPTPSCGLGPAILHDLLTQFDSLDSCPWTRAESNQWFRESMEAGDSPIAAKLYYAAVSGPLGHAFMAIAKSRVTQKLRIFKR